jgi:hypothetical protein
MQEKIIPSPMFVLGAEGQRVCKTMREKCSMFYVLKCNDPANAHAPMQECCQLGVALQFPMNPCTPGPYCPAPGAFTPLRMSTCVRVQSTLIEARQALLNASDGRADAFADLAETVGGALAEMTFACPCWHSQELPCPWRRGGAFACIYESENSEGDARLCALPQAQRESLRRSLRRARKM